MFDATIAELLAREIADGKANPAKVLAFRLSDAPEAEMRRKAREIMESKHAAGSRTGCSTPAVTPQL